jgi:hypothetical protein
MLEHLVPVGNLAPAQAMRRRSGMDLRNTLGRKGFGCDIGVIVGAEWKARLGGRRIEPPGVGAPHDGVASAHTRRTRAPRYGRGGGRGR